MIYKHVWSIGMLSELHYGHLVIAIMKTKGQDYNIVDRYYLSHSPSNTTSHNACVSKGARRRTVPINKSISMDTMLHHYPRNHIRTKTKSARTQNYTQNRAGTQGYLSIETHTFFWLHHPITTSS